MGIESRDGVAAAKQRGGNPVTHVQHWLLLPQSVDPAIWTREIVWTSAGKAESRKDAREARFFDISWPRELPTEFIAGFVTELYAPLIAMGLAVQVDWESSPADDGKPNDHLHGLISTRVLSNAGFSGSKCRELDSWFRSNVRRIVAGLFDAIAQRQDIEIRFDPRPNVEREDALPAEDVLPRGIVRNRQAAGAAKMLDRRDAQRQLRREHDAVKTRIVVLQSERQELLAELEASLADMAILTSWQGTEKNPLAIDSAMSALMGRGVVVRQYIPIPDLGLAFVIGHAVILDQGDRILIEEPVEDEAVRAMHALARGKGWRDLSLMDSFGMPIPVPDDPRFVPAQSPPGPSRWSRLERLGKGHVIQAANGVVAALKIAQPPERQAMLNRVANWGNPCLARLMAQLVPYADASSADPIAAKTIAAMIEHATGNDGDLWKTYVLEQDLVAMTVPGNALSRPFRLHPRFHDYYGKAGGKDRASATIGQEGAGQ